MNFNKNCLLTLHPHSSFYKQLQLQGNCDYEQSSPLSRNNGSIRLPTQNIAQMPLYKPDIWKQRKYLTHRKKLIFISWAISFGTYFLKFRFSKMRDHVQSLYILLDCYEAANTASIKERKLREKKKALRTCYTCSAVLVAEKS